MQRVSRSIAAPSTSRQIILTPSVLLRAIVGFMQGDPQGCRVVRAPTPEEEDARRLHRERQRLVCASRTGPPETGIKGPFDNAWHPGASDHGRKMVWSVLIRCRPAMVGQSRRGLKIEIEREWKRLKGGRRASPRGRSRNANPAGQRERTIWRCSAPRRCAGWSSCTASVPN